MKMVWVFWNSKPQLSYNAFFDTEKGNIGRMYSLGEVNFIQGMHDFGNPKNSVGLKPNAELRKDAKAPSIPKS